MRILAAFKVTLCLDREAYRRIGFKQRDDNVVAVSNEVQIVGLVSDGDFFNFSFLVQERVELEDGAACGDDPKRYRTFAIVVDGQLHLPRFEVRVEEAGLASRLESLAGGVITGWGTSDDSFWELDLSSLPLCEEADEYSIPQLVEALMKVEQLRAQEALLSGRVVKEPAEDEYRGNPEEDQRYAHTRRFTGCRYALLGVKQAQVFRGLSGFSGPQKQAFLVRVRSDLLQARFDARELAWMVEQSNQMTWRAWKPKPNSKKTTYSVETIEGPGADCFAARSLIRTTWTQVVGYN